MSSDRAFGCTTCRALPATIEALNDRLLKVRAYFDRSHDHYYLRQCKTCGQYYLEQFREILDWGNRWGADQMWNYWVPITPEEQKALEKTFPEEVAERERLGVLAAIVRGRPRLTYDATNTFTWSDTPWTISDILPPG
jgi:hypothetical protein